MKRLIASLMLVVGLPALLLAQEIKDIPSDKASVFGEKLAVEAAKLPGFHVKIEADATQANGIHVPDMLGVIVVPQKGLKEGDELAAKFKADRGAAFAYLFLYHVVPVANGSKVKAEQLQTLKITDDKGETHEVNVLLLTAKQIADDDYRLQAYGSGDKPVVEAKFSQEEEKEGPVVQIAAKDPDEAAHEGTIEITVFGKYRATFRAAHVE